ncbi:MAG TPA: FkbM family methyltransferase [Anaerolineales bacterium]|nr:FkbM family methyltransferase [Anaerolineales bacterium]
MFDRIKRLRWKIINWRYAQFAVRAERPGYLVNSEYDKIQQQLKAEGYYSQVGQDKWIIEKLFADKVDGTFVDIGAHDGVTFSNTYLLEKKGWNGIAIEPNPLVYEKLSKNRKCITIKGCITSKPGKGKFRMITGYPEMLSGLITEYDARHVNRIYEEINSRGGEYKDIDVDCYNLVELLKSYKMLQVDYLSMDIEGAEYEVLKSIDFDRINIAVIGVENNYLDWRIPKLLISKGYEFNSIVGDEFYINKKTK